MNGTRVLLTAFEPFDGDLQNASQCVAESALPSLRQRCELSYRLLPVTRYGAKDRLIEELDRFGPELVIMLGQAARRCRVTPERVAINMDWFPIPDNAGEQPMGETISSDGPAGYFSTLPVTAIAERISAGGVDASVSNTAGLYVCNHVFYSAMHYIARMESPPMAGFIHLPKVADDNHNSGQGLSLEAMTAAVGLAFEECLVALETRD